MLNLPPATPYRLYLSDMAISHFVDSKLMIIDGESLNVVGHVALGMTGHVTLTPDRSELLVSTAYMTKLNRGERIGQMDVYDASTLKLKAEISVPPKHSQSMPYRGKIRTSADGRLVMMQNSTPASSVTVVDRVAGKFVAEIATPGWQKRWLENFTANQAGGNAEVDLVQDGWTDLARRIREQIRKLALRYAVAIDRRVYNVPLDTVLVDNIDATRRAVEHLIAQGHRRIGAIVGHLTSSTGAERLRGYTDALMAHDIPVSDALIRIGTPRSPVGSLP